MSPNAHNTPLSPKSVSNSTSQSPKQSVSNSTSQSPIPSVSNSTSQSPKPSTSFGLPTSHCCVESPNILQQTTLSLDTAIKFVIDNLTNETVFKDYTPDIYQPGLEKITIQTHSNTKEKRKFDKYNICLYCAKCVLKMGRHLCDLHSDKEEVQHILKMKSPSTERKEAIALLTYKGNFLHNCHILKKGKGVLLF